MSLRAAARPRLTAIDWQILEGLAAAQPDAATAEVVERAESTVRRRIFHLEKLLADDLGVPRRDGGAVEREGRTLVPLELYFGSNGMAKIKLALAMGRKAPDKRDVEKKRDWDRQKGRILRDRG